MTPLPPDAPRPRICVIRKEFPEQPEYGFNLHAERGKSPFIGAVDADSPADLAGLRQGDRIVAVNGYPVAQEPHRQVVSKIKEHPMTCTLVVIDEEGESWYLERRIPIPFDENSAVVAIPARSASPKSEKSEKTMDSPVVPSAKSVEMPDDRKQSSTTTGSLPPLRPRWCKLVKRQQGQEFGFNLHAERNNGQFIGAVDPGSIAERAGLEEGQRIVGVNGQLVQMNTSNKDVVNLIKSDMMQTELLVASPEVDQWYKQNGRQYSFEDAEVVAPLEGRYAQLNGFSNGNESENGKEEVTEKLEKQDDHVQQSHEYDSKHDGYQHTIEVKDTPPPSRPQYADVNVNGVSNTAPTEDWMMMTAAELRERVAQHKKVDPRTQQLTLQQKFEIIRNL